MTAAICMAATATRALPGLDQETVPASAVLGTALVVAAWLPAFGERD